MGPKEIFDHLKRKLGDNIAALDESVKSPYIQVARESIYPVMECLRDDPELQFDFLQLVTAIDYPDRFVCAYHLYSYPKTHEIAIKTDLPRENPSVASVAPLWPAADWHEREQFDLMGVVFEGHPNLRRIMLPEDWEGHPLRKDYVQPDEYHGISNVRKAGRESYPRPDEDAKAIPPYKPPAQPAAAAAPMPHANPPKPAE